MTDNPRDPTKAAPDPRESDLYRPDNDADERPDRDATEGPLTRGDQPGTGASEGNIARGVDVQGGDPDDPPIR